MNCELLWNSQIELAVISGLGSGRKWNGQREGKVTERLSLVKKTQDVAISVEEEASFVQSYKSCARDLDLKHALDARLPGEHRMQVWSQSSYLPVRRSDFHASTNVPVSRDLLP